MSQERGIALLVIPSSSFGIHTVRGSYFVYNQPLDRQQIVSPSFLNQRLLRSDFNTFLKSKTLLKLVSYPSLRTSRLQRTGQATFRSYLPKFYVALSKDDCPDVSYAGQATT